jgi:hypothetical protein
MRCTWHRNIRRSAFSWLSLTQYFKDPGYRSEEFSVRSLFWFKRALISIDLVHLFAVKASCLNVIVVSRGHCLRLEQRTRKRKSKVEERAEDTAIGHCHWSGPSNFLTVVFIKHFALCPIISQFFQATALLSLILLPSSGDMIMQILLRLVLCQNWPQTQDCDVFYFLTIPVPDD